MGNERKKMKTEATLASLTVVIGGLNSNVDADIAKSLDYVSALPHSKEEVDLLFDSGVVLALVRLVRNGHQHAGRCASLLGRITRKPIHQDLLAKEGTLSSIVGLLNMHHNQNSPEANKVVSQAAYALTRLVHENDHNKGIVREEGAIPVLVKLLKVSHEMVVIAAIKALGALASDNDEIKTQIVDSQALPTLVLLLGLENCICREAVCLINTLARGSPHIQAQVWLARALHPIIKLLSFTCSKTQREAAILIGRLAADSDRRGHIAQRGALVPLVEMLESQDEKSKECASYALGRLAQDEHAHIQVGIAHAHGIPPLVKLLDSSNNTLRVNGAYALSGLALSKEIVEDLIKAGCFEKLLESRFDTEQTKGLAQTALTRLEESFHVKEVLDLLVSVLISSDKPSQNQILLALAFLCSPDDQKRIFVDNNGIDLLLKLLQQTRSKLSKYACAAFCRLAEKATSISLVDAEPLSPISKVCRSEQHVDSLALSDVTFVVEGKQINACKTRLCAYSDAFRAMFNDGFKEKDAKEIEIPNIGFEAFKLMMEYIDTGLVVDLSIPRIVVYDLLIAADQYLLQDLKHSCENTIVQDINADKLGTLYDLSCVANAVSLRRACCLFALKNFQELKSRAWYRTLIRKMVPDIKDYFVEMLDET